MVFSLPLRIIAALRRPEPPLIVVPVPPVADPVPAVSVEVIEEPGRYAMLGDLNGSLEIRASGVVLDMQGHTVSGESEAGTTTCGIAIAAGSRDVTIRGGHVRGHHYGLRADATERLVVDRMSFTGQTFRGVRADGPTVSVTQSRFERIGGTRLYSDAYAMAIEVNGADARLEDNAIREIYPTDSGEAVGVLLGYGGEGSIIARNTVVNSRIPETGRSFGIWCASDRASIHDNVVVMMAYGVEGPGSRDNLCIDIPCGSYKGLESHDFRARTGRTVACPDDYPTAMSRIDVDDRNSMFRLAQIHHHAGDTLMAVTHFRLAARAGSTEAADEADRLAAAGLVTSDEMQQAETLADMLAAHHRGKRLRGVAAGNGSSS